MTLMVWDISQLFMEGEGREVSPAQPHEQGVKRR